MASYYLNNVFNPFRLRRIAIEAEVIREREKAEIVVVRGLSGVLVATAMSTLFGTPFAVVRKDTESSHGEPLELSDRLGKFKNWIIVDDLISSGKTIEQIADRVRVYQCCWSISGKCKGIILYRDSRSGATWEVLGKKVPIFCISINWDDPDKGKMK